MSRKQVTALCLLLAAQLQLTTARSLRLRPRHLTDEAHGRIVGGSETSIGEYPWQLGVVHADRQTCGASIISESWALTEDTCLTYADPRLYKLRAGSSSRSSGGTVLDLVEIVSHPQHDLISGDYNIAVARVYGSFPLGPNVAIVSLPEDGYDPPVGLAVTVTGWGSTESADVSDILMKVDINVMEREACNDIDDVTGHVVTPRMLCAGHPGQSACYGDQGSPLVAGSTQLGIMSWSNFPCERSPAVYMNVGQLRSWVTSVTGV